ncbi:MAG TPA: hypothetical protein VF816_12005, partial [Rhodocyclaceae bacterium]
APAAAAVQPAAAPNAARDALIDSILAVSGLADQMERLPEELANGAKPSLDQANMPAEDKARMRALISTSYSAKGFAARVKGALTANFDEARFRRVLATVSTPVARRMAALEKERPAPQAVQAFFAKLATEPLSPARVKLIRDLDEASGTSDLAVAVTIANAEAMVRAIAAGCGDKAPDIGGLERQRPQIKRGVQNTVQAMMAFTYRGASDADLGEYVKTYQAPDSRWFMGIVKDALTAEFAAGATAIGQGMVKMAQAKAKPGAMKCGATAPAAATAHKVQPQEAPAALPPQAAPAAAPAPASTPAKAMRTRSGQDARGCLRFEDSRKVMACAEAYR